MNLNYESGKVGDYSLYCRKGQIYQGTSENLNLIFWDGSG